MNPNTSSIVCPDCGANLPERHFQLHKLRGCSSRPCGRKDSSRSSPPARHVVTGKTTPVTSTALANNHENDSDYEKTSRSYRPNSSRDDGDTAFLADDEPDSGSDSDDSVKLLSSPAVRRLKAATSKRRDLSSRGGNLGIVARIDAGDTEMVSIERSLSMNSGPGNADADTSSTSAHRRFMFSLAKKEEQDSKPPARRRRRLHDNTGGPREVIDLSDGFSRVSPVLPASTAAATSLEDLTGDHEMSRADSGATSAAAAISIDDDDEDDDSNHWSCDKCTFLNPSNRSDCQICGSSNPEYVRPPDSIRRERLIDDSVPSTGSPFSGLGRSYLQRARSINGPSSPVGYAGIGGLMGAAVGAAGNYIQGRDPLRGALEGGTTGAVGGALLHQAMRMDNGIGASNNPILASSFATSSQGSIAAARSSAAMGVAGYPSNGAAARSSWNGARPRSSFRMERSTQGENEVTVVYDSNGTTTHVTSRRRNPRRHTSDADLQLQLLLQHYRALITNAGSGGTGMYDGPNIDAMNYEEMLRRFGNGTENMGAHVTIISQLPTHKLTDPKRELPEDARMCNICLEEFVEGDIRMCLPCIHGFHEECCEKWLRQNGKCPVCQHHVGNNQLNDK